jgi:hypothetical protein
MAIRLREQPAKAAAKHLAAAQRTVDIENAFVQQALRMLPLEAFRRLFRLRAQTLGDPRLPIAVQEWARAWTVDAPCMILYAAWLWTEARQLDAADRAKEIDGPGGPTFHLSVGRNFACIPPANWLAELRLMDETPLSPFRENVLDRIATDDDPKAASPQVLAQLRENILDEPEAYAPISADPLHETWATFRRRAETHYRSRRRRLERLQLATIDARRSPELERHVEWLLRFHLKRESYADILRQDSSASDRTTVVKAIHDIAAAIGLPLRHVRRGRRRTKW